MKGNRRIQKVNRSKEWENQRLKSQKPRQKKEEKQDCDNSKVEAGISKEKDTSRENRKEGEIVPDLDLRGSGPSDVSIS